MHHKLKVLDLFSGIGGFSLGLERAGMETVAFCEIEDYPRKVLKKHWPDVPIYEDIRELTSERLKADGITADLICGGYPCQPFSTAGKRQGEGDDRHLWPEMYRLIKTLRPRWVIAENVAGHISMGLDAVLSDLEAEDYAWWPFVIPACGANAPHSRDRLWLIANTRENPNNQQRAISQDNIFMGKTGINGVGIRSQYNGIFEPIEQYYSNDANMPAICGENDGFSKRLDRIEALGNAVVPQIPEIIGRAIMEIENAP